jgi:hypothetical protein
MAEEVRAHAQTATVFTIVTPDVVYLLAAQPAHKTNVEFVAITNDVLADAGRHYLTVWMRGDADSAPARIGDAAEINQLGWFAPGNLPRPLHIYFQNLLEGRCWPRSPANMPFTIPPKS